MLHKSLRDVAVESIKVPIAHMGKTPLHTKVELNIFFDRVKVQMSTDAIFIITEVDYRYPIELR